MNPTLKIAIGASIGGAIGYFIGQVAVEYIKMQEGADGYDGSEEFPVDMPKKVGKKEPMKSQKEKPAKKVNYQDLYKDRPDIIKFVEKYNISDDTKKLTDEDILDPDEIVDGALTLDEIREDIIEDTEEEIDQDIMVISYNDFIADEESEHVYLTYYLDDILTDEKDIPIDRPERFLGDDALISFDDSGVVYVRNKTKKAVYKIIQLTTEYAEPDSRNNGSSKRSRGMRGNNTNEETSSAED